MAEWKKDNEGREEGRKDDLAEVEKCSSEGEDLPENGGYDHPGHRHRNTAVWQRGKSLPKEGRGGISTLRRQDLQIAGIFSNKDDNTQHGGKDDDAAIFRNMVGFPTIEEMVTRRQHQYLGHLGRYNKDKIEAKMLNAWLHVDGDTPPRG